MMNDIYKALEKDDKRAAASQRTYLNNVPPRFPYGSIRSRWRCLDGLLDLGDEICFPDDGTSQSASMTSGGGSQEALATSDNKEEANSSDTVDASATAKKKIEDPNGVEFQKLVSWTKDVSNRKSAAAQVKAEAEAFAQEQGKKPGQGQGEDNAILLSKFSKQPKSKKEVQGNTSSSPSPGKKGLFNKGKGSTKGNASSATHNKKVEASSPPKATPKEAQQQQQATEERQEANDDWRRMVSNKAPNPKASQNNMAPAYDPRRDIPSGAFIPPLSQSVYGAPMNDPGYRYGIPAGSPQPHHYGQHY